MEITNRRYNGLIKNKSFYKKDKIKTYRKNYKNKKKYKKHMDIREVLLAQCIICSILLLILLSFNYIDNKFTYNLRVNIKKLISEDIKKEKLSSYFDIVSSKITNISGYVHNKILGKNKEGKIINHVFKNKNKVFRIDEDILEEIKKYEKEKDNIKYKNSDFYEKIIIEKDNKIWINPTEGIVTSLFGKRVNPISKKEEFHNGIDIAIKENTELLAIGDGVVKDISFSDTFGNVLKYEIDNTYEIMYAHLNNIKVNIGDKVKQGDIIALSGNTGLSTGPHLHLTIFKDKELIDPIDYVKLPYTEDVKKELEKREAF